MFWLVGLVFLKKGFGQLLGLKKKKSHQLLQPEAFPLHVTSNHYEPPGIQTVLSQTPREVLHVAVFLLENSGIQASACIWKSPKSASAEALGIT